jgi:hypothetical protein
MCRVNSYKPITDKHWRKNTLMQESKPTYKQTKMTDNKNYITEH